MRPVIVVASGTSQDVSVEEAHLGTRGSVRLASLASPEEVGAATLDADAIVVTTNPLTRAHIGALGPGVRVIGRAGTGLDAIDFEAAAERAIVVYHTPDYCTAEVATHAVALILAAHRRLPQADRLARTDYRAWRDLGPIGPLDELTAGVVGSGRIGRAVMARLLPMVARVVAFDPYTSAVPEGVEPAASLDELLGQADILTLHLPLSPETRGLVGADQLARLPVGAIVVNASRGGIVDEVALCAALASGHLAGAALDVLVNEPPAPDDPVLRAPGLLLTPHVAWYSTASERRVRTQVIDGVLACLEGRPPATGRIALDPRAPGGGAERRA